jgi:OOP family OmpA-OmpF porin
MVPRSGAEFEKVAMSRRVSVLLGVVGASLFAASGAFAQAAGGSVSVGGTATTPTGQPAQPAPPPPAPAPVEDEEEPVLTPGPSKPSGDPRVLIDVHVGGVTEIDQDPETESGTGALVGGGVYYGPLKWLDVGLTYERSYLGTDDLALAGGGSQRTTRGAHSLWLNARFYPYENEDVALFVELAGGPSWQTMSSSSAPTPSAGNPTVGSVSTCDAYDSARPAFRGGLGAMFPLQATLVLHGQVGIDHYGYTGDVVDGCTSGGRPDTAAALRIGLAYAWGRVRIPDSDGDGIHDDTDACKKEPGVPNNDPARHGCPAVNQDRDRDTVLDAVDACPDVPGAVQPDPSKNGCPLPGDMDGDGIPDPVDACPTVPGAANPDPAKNGCPLDTDADGIFDPVDACPTVPGKPNPDPAKNGCPDDTDGDGILDAVDACPKDPGPANADPAKNGCPLVVVTAGEIKINEQVQFDTDKATIKPVSNALLDSVAAVIKAHPEIKKLEVQGHTDSQGPKAHNQQLSQQRAESVRKALESRGVEKTRLVSKGYGQDKPIGDNSTDVGRTQNRRVQFVILEKTAVPPKVIGTEVAPGATQVTPPPAPAPAPKP